MSKPSASLTKAPRTQEERNAAAKEKICIAALELFSMHGYERATLNEIGLRAGYSRGIVAYHFGTKTALAQHLLRVGGTRDMFLSDLSLSPETSGEEAWSRLQRHLEDTWANFCAKHRAQAHSPATRGELVLGAAAIFSGDPDLRSTVDEELGQLCDNVASILRRCIETGVVRANSDPDAIATYYVFSIWGLVNAMLCGHGERGTIPGAIDCLRDYLQSLRTH
jgi:AcrR family transcriptional regulator